MLSLNIVIKEMILHATKQALYNTEALASSLLSRDAWQSESDRPMGVAWCD